MKVVDMAIDQKNVFFFYTYFFWKMMMLGKFWDTKLPTGNHIWWFLTDGGNNDIFGKWVKTECQYYDTWSSATLCGKMSRGFLSFFSVQGTYYMCRRWGQNLYAIETTKVYWILCCLNVANGEFYTFLSKKMLLCCYGNMDTAEFSFLIVYAQINPWTPPL